jgi:hypothetical protein
MFAFPPSKSRHRFYISEASLCISKPEKCVSEAKKCISEGWKCISEIQKCGATAQKSISGAILRTETLKTEPNQSLFLRVFVSE